MEDESNYRETDHTVRGIPKESADSLRDLTELGLQRTKQDQDYILRVEPRADGLYDFVVLKRVN